MLLDEEFIFIFFLVIICQSVKGGRWKEGIDSFGVFSSLIDGEGAGALI